MAKGTVAVSGTAEGEWAVGTNAPKLVTAWDKLKLWPIAIFGRTWKKHPIAMIQADVAMPIKAGANGGRVKEAGATKLRMMVVAVPDGQAWKWVAIAFGDGFESQAPNRPNWTPPKS